MISELFAQFIKEKRYIANLSERTIRSYEKDVFNRWLKLVGEMPTKQNLMRFVAGMRISECLNLTLENIDWDNLLIKVTGKGNKQRILPISIELRKVLSHYVNKQRFSKYPTPYLLCTSTGTAMGYNNIKKEFNLL